MKQYYKIKITKNGISHIYTLHTRELKDALCFYAMHLYQIEVLK